ncbi:DNA helicase [Pseudodesulfovibrio profundus]|uniref:DNA 3'-5' helicase n=1 Tax=Pseudodesulfovibrio profundus TaxID=57320 RepID=A0A2C8F558_9BACT|nr:UvrD-helicase domain-containing protein [Pseudodesulfovibrio profundus]SOB57857.1 DNA helicase [Pseudodesulfovibrio profundus]
MSELKQVKAAAGSGKTYQLTRRFLTLLDNADSSQKQFACVGKPHRGYAWPEIMAVTFTNKAATEMKERVISGLKHAALLPDQPQMTNAAPETAAKAIDSILRRYHRLNIRTIDSLLALLLRLFSLEFGIRPDFQIVFDESELFDAVFDHYLTVCSEQEAEYELLTDTMETMLHSEGRTGFWIQDTMRKRLLELTRFLRNTPDSLLTDQDEIKTQLVNAHSDYKQSVQTTLTTFANCGLPFAKRFNDFLMGALDQELFDTPKDSAYLKKESLCDCVNKAGKDKVDADLEQVYRELKQACSRYASDHAILTGAYFMAPAINIALRVLNGLDELQRQRGMILGSSLAGYVNYLLAEGDAVSEAYCRLGCRLHHLLVDEFQDTSREQWQAITPLAQECLAKGGSLYYVGDVKQAIYGWRGGDSALFDEIITQPEVADLAQHTKSDTLPDNWRSFKNVVEFNNTFFSNLENPIAARELADTLFSDADTSFQEDFARDITVGFQGCAQSLPPKSVDTEGYVRFQQLPGGNASDVEEQTLESLDTLLDEVTLRRRYRDIAILVRSHDHASVVCDLLVDKGIPVITENSLQLDRHPIVRQLISLLEFIDFPRNDMALLTLITGNELFLAESGIDEEQLSEWLTQPRKRPLGVCFRQDFPEAWSQFIEPFYNQSGVMTPYDLTREAIRVFRVFERHQDAELYIRRFLEVVHLSEENGCSSLSAFLQYWSEKSGEEKVPLPENIDAVHIMTIHKSKGLEFPVVIVPFHNWNASPDQNFTIRKHNGHALLTPMKKGLGKAYQTSLGRNIREQLNLLYVAWTRAREELYGFFTEKPSLSPATVAMTQFLDINDDMVFEYGSLDDSKNLSEKPKKHMPNTLPKQEDMPSLMEWLPRLRVYRHNREEYFYNAAMRGEIAHRVMEYLRLTGDDAVDKHRAIQLAVQDFPAVHALEEVELHKLHADLDSMTDWILSEPAIRELLKSGLREPEVMDSEGAFKRFDLLHIGDTTTVADFKTGHPAPENEQQVIEYMNILREMGHSSIQGMLIYLDLHTVRYIGGEA